MADRPLLRQLADDLGIVASYVGTGGVRVETSDTTRVALLAAMGVDAASERAARTVLGERQQQRHAARIDPVRVVRLGDRAARRLPLQSAPAAGTWELEVVTESGERCRGGGRLRPAMQSLPLPRIDEVGQHRVRLAMRNEGGAWEGEQSFFVAPKACVSVAERLGGTRGFGLCANLYSVRDGRSDFGDLTTLQQLVRWAGTVGASFVGVNPLCAIRARGPEISPYSPTTRLFRSELYLDVEAIPESASLPLTAKRRPADEDDALLLDYEGTLARKRKQLRRLHGIFVQQHAAGTTQRGRAYRRFVADGGAMLQGFAVFCVLDEWLGTASGGSEGWREWPSEYREPQSEAVGRVARAKAREVDFHCWLQFELDRQLAATAAIAARAGLRLGLYQDLPIAAVPSGYEEWSMRGLFCSGASVGAPPDAFFAGGQNWGLAPWHPGVLRQQRYAYWQNLLRAAFAHAGALRVDHVMGLARQYWIPTGSSAGEGAYVRMPADELFGVLALESRRAGAVVIGEDLGTVPQEIPALLRRWGVLSTKVLYFEKTAGGGFRAPSTLPEAAFVSANTHDLATLNGFTVARELELHRAAGVLDAAQFAAARDTRRTELQSLRRWSKATPDAPLTPAVYGRLAQAPSALLGIALDDLSGEVEPVNLPGVPGEVYPSWRRRMRRSLQQLASDRLALQTLGAVERQRPAVTSKRRGTIRGSGHGG